MDRKYIVALEISGTQVRGALASVAATPSGNKSTLQIDAIESEENHDSVRNGRVQNPKNASKNTANVIRRIKTQPAIDGNIITGCYVALYGRSFASIATTTQIELPTETMIDKDSISRLFRDARKHAPRDRKVVKVLPRRFYVDGIVQDDPEGSLGRSLRGDFTIIVCDPVNQRNLDMVIEKECGMHVIDYIPQPIAVAGMALTEEEKQLGCMLVDVGAQTTTVSIYKERALQYLCTLPMGSYNITRDIANGMNITMDKAEAVKHAQGNAMPDHNRPADDSARINSYVEARAKEIAVNIVAALEYAGYTYSDLSAGIVICGRGSRLKNFERLLKEQSNMKVRRATLPSSMTFDLTSNNHQPADFVQLLAVVNSVANRPDFTSCVETVVETRDEETFIVESPLDVVIPQTEPQTEPEISQEPEQTDPQTLRPTTNIFIDGIEDTDIDINDGEQEPETPPTEPTDIPGKITKGGRNKIINKLKEKLFDLMGNDGMAGDSELD